MEALQAATIVPARAMKVEAESGSVEVGKRADLDVLDANPLDNIHNVRTVTRCWRMACCTIPRRYGRASGSSRDSRSYSESSVSRSRAP